MPGSKYVLTAKNVKSKSLLSYEKAFLLLKYLFRIQVPPHLILLWKKQTILNHIQDLIVHIFLQ